MRALIALLIPIIFACNSKPNGLVVESENDMRDQMCDEETLEAIRLLKNDSMQYILINESPRYEKELSALLKESNIQLRFEYQMHGEAYCLKAVMDNAINEYFGESFRNKIENRADSLYLESNRGSIFQEQFLDKRPTLTSNADTNGQDGIIKRLNSKFSAEDSIELISNIVNSPYFVVKFKVSNEGMSSDAEIIERNSTDDYVELENTIINEINGLTEWNAGQIRNESVSSVIDVAIAIKKK